jgi:segregation and condensation protein A
MTLSIRLNNSDFDGPLDILLELVRNQKLDLATVNLVDLIDQYLNVVETENLTKHAEYASIAATLIAIKCRKLLPIQEEDIDEEEQLREKLVVYQKYLDASSKIKQKLENEKLPVYKEENILGKYVTNIPFEESGDMQDIISALWLIIDRNITKKVFDNKLINKSKISPKTANEQLELFLESKKNVNYIEFIKNKSKEFVIYSFLHLLSLIKNNSIKIIQLSDEQIIIKRIKNER